MSSKSSLGLGVTIALAAIACGGPPKAAVTPPPPAPPVAEPAAPLVVTPPEPELPAIPATPAAAPAELIVTLVNPAPTTLIAPLAAYLDHAVPGLGQQLSLDVLTAAALGAGLDLRAVDLGRPLWVLLLDPARFAKPFVVVAGVGDEAALAAQVKQEGLRYQRHDGFVAIGTTEALTAAGGYALTTLVTAPPPSAPTLDVDVASLMRRYGSTLDGLVEAGSAALPADQQAMTQGLLRAYLGLFAQLDRARFTLAVDRDVASVTLALTPLPGTAFATFIGHQAPATFAELERLPPGVMSMGGRLDLRGALDTMMAAMAPMMAKMYGEGMAGMMSASQRWIAIAAGENGFSADFGPGKMEMSGVLHVDDPAAMRAIWTELLAAMAKAKGGAAVITIGGVTYKGVKVSTYTVALGPDATAEQRAAFAAFGDKLTYGFAVVGDSAAFAMGASGLGRIKALVDQVRAGKKPKVTASAELLAALADARGRHESYVMAFDVAAVMARFLAPVVAPPARSGPLAPGIIAVGADGGALTIRTSVPAVQVGAVVALKAQADQHKDAEIDAVLVTMGSMADDLCRCTDQACADGVMKAMASMREPSGKPTEAQLQQAMTIAGRMAECQKRLTAASPAP